MVPAAEEVGLAWAFRGGELRKRAVVPDLRRLVGHLIGLLGCRLRAFVLQDLSPLWWSMNRIL